MFSSDAAPRGASGLPTGNARRIRPGVLAAEELDAFGGAAGDAFAAWLPDDIGADSPLAEFTDPSLRSGQAHAHGAFDVGGDSRSAAEREADEAAQRAEAERLTAEEAAQAEAEAQAAFEQALGEAYEAGLAAGREEGAAAAQQELEAVTAALMQALADVRGGEQRWLAALEDNVAALATAIARHVIGREVVTDASIVVSVVRQAIAEFPLDEPLTLRVCPADLPALRAALGAAPGAGVRELRWVPEPRVERGGALVEGRERIVDGRVDSALERVYRRLAHHQA